MKKLHALVLGATGATGQELVKLLLKNSDFSKVSIFVRRAINFKHEKLIVHKVDFSRLNNYKNLINGDVFFSCLGTTRKDAGSKKEQYKVDYTYQYEFAKMASDNRVSQYSLVSSIGANNKSYFFYPRIKGDLEESVKNLNFNKIHIFQPPSLVRQPDLIRSGEKISLKILSILNKIGLLRSFRPLSVEYLAIKMIRVLKEESQNKIKIYKVEDLHF